MEQLKQVGLTENESNVYLALIDLGPSLAGQITRKSGLHRRTVYDTLDMLIKKGLVGYILSNNRRLFQASNPDRLLEIIKEKENLVSPIILGLQEKYNKTKEKEQTNFYKGKEGLKTVFEDQLNYEEVLILGANEKAEDILRFYLDWYNNMRKKKKMKARVITQSRNIKMPMADIKYLPEKYSSPVAINIYGDKTAIILWASEPIVILIKNKEISDGYRNYFELIWKIAKK